MVAHLFLWADIAVSALLFLVLLIIHVFPINSIDFMYEQIIFSYPATTKKQPENKLLFLNSEII